MLNRCFEGDGFLSSNRIIKDEHFASLCAGCALQQTMLWKTKAGITK